MNFRYTTNKCLVELRPCNPTWEQCVRVFSLDNSSDPLLLPGFMALCTAQRSLPVPTTKYAGSQRLREDHQRVCALALTLNPRWCQAKSSETPIATLTSAPSDLECTESFPFSLSKQSCGCVLPLFSGSRWHSVPWARGRVVLSEKAQVSTRLCRAQLPAMERKGTFLV